MKKLIVTIPAKDEEKTLPIVINEIHNSIKGLHYNWEIIVVNDGSTDGTVDICRQLNIPCVSHTRSMGLASVFRTEIKECIKRGADIIVHIDADGQYMAAEIPKLMQNIERGYDLVLGSRFLGTIEEMPTIKRFGNQAFSKVISSITKQKITDAQTGFRAFTREVAEAITIRSDHTYTQEQILRASLQNFRIMELPVVFRKRISGKSRLIKSPFEYAFKAWINILRTYRDFEPLKFFGLTGLFVFSIAIPFMLRLLYYFFTTGVTGHIFSVMIVILCTITGLQIILFGFLADMKNKV